MIEKSTLDPTSEEFPQGFQLGQYRIVARLGQGGMGTVYKATHVRLKRVVALKVLHAWRAQHAQAHARFAREMEAVGKLDHPNLIRATDAGEEAGHPYLVMDFIDGLDLHRLVQGTGPLAPADACELARQAAAGMHYIHEHGLVHRDIKPSNLMLAPDGRVRVLDLGLSRLYEGPAGDERLTDTDQVMGTADYMAPEQGTSSHHVDIRADIYSLGCALYFLLAGKPPFSGPAYDSRFKKILAHAQTPVPPIRAGRPEVPEALIAVLERMLAKAPADRFATPAEVAAALAPFTAGSDPAALLAAARRALPAEPADAAPVGRAGMQGETRSHELQTPNSASFEGIFPPLPARQPKRWRLLLLAAALLVMSAAGLLLVLQTDWFGPAAAPPRPDGPAPAVEAEAARHFRAGQWQPLLTRTPSVLVWPSPPMRSSWAFDPGSKSITVNCHDVALLGLGTTRAPSYVLQVGIEQSRWHGGVGCFFGFHEVEEGGQQFIQFQCVELVPFRPNDDKRAFKMCRSAARFRVVGKRSLPVRIDHLADQALPKPLPGEHILEVTVERRGLTRVRWGGSELNVLVEPAVNAHVLAGKYQGPFGTFSNASAGVFQNARFMSLEEDDP